MIGLRRVPWLGLFGRLVIRDVLTHVAIAGLAAVSLHMAVDSVEAINRALSRATVGDLLLLQLCNVPNILQQFSTICVLLGTTSAVAALVRRQEVVAMLAAGAPTTALLKPALVAGLILALGYSAMTEWIAPTARAEVSAARRRLGLPAPEGDAFNRGRAWFRGADRVYRVQSLEDSGGRVLGRVLMLALQGGRVAERWDVERLRYDSGKWIAEAATVRTLGADTLATRLVPRTELVLAEEPEDFVRSIGAPDRLPYAALLATTRAREKLGQPATMHRFELYRRHAYPLALLAAVVLSSAVALRLGRRPSLAQSLGAGVVVGFAFWVTDEVCVAGGSSGAIPAWAAAHTTLLLAALGAAEAWRRVARSGLRTFRA